MEMALLTNDFERQFQRMRAKRIPVTKDNIRVHVPGFGGGAARGLQIATETVERYKVAYGDNLIAAFVFGAVGRGFPKSRLPKDIDLMLVVRDLGKAPALSKKDHALISKMVLPLSYLQDALAKPNDEGRFHRRVLALNNICLHGLTQMRELRRTALAGLRTGDFDRYVEKKTRRRAMELRERRKHVPSEDTLRRIVAHDYGIDDALHRSTQVKRSLK